MSEQDRREFPRTDSLSLLSYVCVNESGEAVMQGMGRTLNVNETGILLETHAPIDPQYTVSLHIGLEDDLVEVRGKVVHQVTGEDGKSRIGVEFMQIDESNLAVLKRFITAFNKQQT